MAVGSYTQEGLQGLLKDGGTGRRKAVEQVAASLGGSVEAMYYAFGEDDFFIIFDAPDNVSAAASSLLVNVTGAVNFRIVALLTPEEIDEAAQKTVNYRPPGQ